MRHQQIHHDRLFTIRFYTIWRYVTSLLETPSLSSLKTTTYEHEVTETLSEFKIRKDGLSSDILLSLLPFQLTIPNNYRGAEDDDLSLMGKWHYLCPVLNHNPQEHIQNFNCRTLELRLKEANNCK